MTHYVTMDCLHFVQQKLFFPMLEEGSQKFGHNIVRVFLLQILTTCIWVPVQDGVQI